MSEIGFRDNEMINIFIEQFEPEFEKVQFIEEYKTINYFHPVFGTNIGVICEVAKS